MPLSKARQAEYMREYRERLKSVVPDLGITIVPVIPNSVVPDIDSVIPKDALYYATRRYLRR